MLTIIIAVVDMLIAMAGLFIEIRHEEQPPAPPAAHYARACPR